MITVAAAEKIVLDNTKNYGTESIPFDKALGLVLAEDIIADRDLPPYNRVTMDGIAIRFDAFERGERAFHIKATQAAGNEPIEMEREHDCIEIMTGASLPATADTVIRYEDVYIENGIATVTVNNIQRGQNIHCKGADKKQGAVIVASGSYVTPEVIAVAASTGYSELRVKKLPRLMVVSTGDELREVTDTPSAQQIRRSNDHTIKAVLAGYGINAITRHLHDEEQLIKEELKKALAACDVIILTGGISMGKYDLLPGVLDSLEVEQLFHKVKQRPGKPFWFGIHKQGAVVFAFPGNPVSAFMCLQRYFIPWLKKCLDAETRPPLYAALDSDYTFKPELQYFLQVKLYTDNKGQLLATPVTGNGSGDFANLTEADAFIELPLEQSTFKQGEAFRIWPFGSLFK